MATNTIGTAYIQIEPSTKGIGGSISQALDGEASAAGASAGGKLSGALGGAAKVGISAIAGATAAVGAFAGASIKAGADFDSSMSQVAATMGFSVSELNDSTSAASQTMETLRNFAQDMGSSTAFSASEAADALNYMALAGYDAETSMNMLPNVLNLAAAGGIDLASASDMVTDAQTALGLSLDETSTMVDQMAATASKSNTSVSQLGEAFLTIGANARNLSGGTTELSTVLGVLADNGIKGAEAGTHLRNIMLSMNPTTDAAVAAWESLGVSAYDADGNLRPLQDTFADLNAAMEGMSEQEKSSTLTSMFNKTDLASINALLGTEASRFTELSSAIEGASGAASDMAGVQLDNLSGDVTLFQSALEGAKIAISDQLAPSLREFVQLGSDGLSNVTSAFKSGGLSAAMSAMGDTLSQGISLIVSKLPEFMAAGVELLNSLMQGISENLPMLAEAAVDIVIQLGEFFIDNLPLLIEAGFEVITQLALGIGQSLPELIPHIVEVVLSIVEYLVNNVDMLVDAAVALITGLAEGIVQATPILVEKTPEIIISLVQAIIANLPQLAVAAFELLSALVNYVIQYIFMLDETANKMMTMLGNYIAEKVTMLVSAGQKIVKAIVDAIKNKVTLLVSAVTEMVKKIKDEFTAKVNEFINIGRDIVEGIKIGFSNAWASMKEWLKGMIGNIVTWAKEILGIGSPSKVMAKEVGHWIPAGIAQGIEGNVGVVTSAMNSVTDELMHQGLNARATFDAAVNTSSDLYRAEGVEAQSEKESEIIDLLRSYLPTLAQGNNVNVTLQGDARSIFRAVRNENDKFIKATGFNALA